jgi:hypothetical protein
MSQDNNHDEWLSLIEISGPFLAVPVLKKAFPQGLEAVDGRVRKYLRQAYDEWCEARDTDDPQFEELHRAWISEVLARGLEYDEKDSGELLKRGKAIPATLHIALPEHGVTLSPDYVLVDGQKVLLLIQTYPADTDLDAAISQQGWVATPAERMVQLCRTTGCRLGLVTNGERWLLIDAPVGSVVTYASWYARLWGQEPLTLQAFLTLLGIRRFFVDASEQLPALFDESLQHQEEVTDALGEQVRRAVEVLIQSLDKEDLNSARTLLQDVAPAQLYEAGLTIMMRLVFLLSAEERGLLLMGDEAYEANYAISTLRMQLSKESDEVLERRHDAWARLLATFRAVYGGIEHEALRLPALGGSLFDPDRFPFLEGRPAGSSWRTDDARPLPIDNRTVLLLLEAIQQYQGRTLSYRALDVEQIGYVYEGLLERTVKRTDAVTVELIGGKGAKKTIHAMADLEAWRARGEDVFVSQLASSDALKRSASAIRKDLARAVDAALSNHLLTVCHGDEALRDRLLPIANLLQVDPWGYPLVYAEGAFIVTTGSDRRETGTHYTPKSLTEAIVAETLTPVAYVGPADGTPREQWVLKSPAELLDLKICDPAMGSGAFLVQACRWLSDRLVEAWLHIEATGKTVSVDGEVLEAGAAKEPLSRDSEARTVIARRLIAERCLYGVDLNPLAVELAKLSIWLVTLAKGRPFGFLDHNLRSGDSLLGLHKLEQLTKFSLHPEKKQTISIFALDIEAAVKDSLALRKQLRKTPILDIWDVQYIERLDKEARQKLEHIEHIADAMIGETFTSGGNQRMLDAAMDNLSTWAAAYIEGDNETGRKIIAEARKSLSIDLPPGKPPRKPFHWALEFPEVFEQGGFDGIVGNPPFLGGKKITGVLGVSYRDSIVDLLAGSEKGAADLISYFFLRAAHLSNLNSCVGLIATDSITDGDSNRIGPEQIGRQGSTIYRAKSSIPWPGSYGGNVAIYHWTNLEWKGSKVLDNEAVEQIPWSLKHNFSFEGLNKLINQDCEFFAGTYINGEGFVLSASEASSIIEKSSECRDVIRKYLTGDSVNTNLDSQSDRFVIDFGTKSYSEASRYGPCFEIVTKRVKPYRETITKQIHEADYWKFWDKRIESYKKIQKFDEVLVAARAAKDVILTWVPNGQVFSDQLVVFATQDYGVFTVLESVFHNVWAWEICTGKYGNGIRYAPSKAVATFPFPNDLVLLGDVGREYLNLRSGFCKEHKLSLNDYYDIYHSPEEIGSIGILRSKKESIDFVVLHAYGWDDLDLVHGFHETKQGIRFTISEDVRREVLQRLLKLNHERYEEEVSAGLHGKTTTPKKSSAAQLQAALSKKTMSQIQAGLDFGKEGS